MKFHVLVRNLALLYDSWTLLYDLKHFYAIFLQSYVIPEHFYTISNTFMQFPYTLIWSWTLPYIPKLNLNPHPRNTHINQKRWLKKGFTGIKV